MDLEEGRVLITIRGVSGELSEHILKEMDDFEDEGERLYFKDEDGACHVYNNEYWSYYSIKSMREPTL